MKEVVDDVMFSKLAKEEEVGYPKLLEHHSSSDEIIVDYCPNSLNFPHSLNRRTHWFCLTSCGAKNENKKLRLLRADCRLGVLAKNLS
jgi:hypothetical protein